MNLRLVAVKIRRRSVSLAIFLGRTLEFTAQLNLCNEPEEAMESLARLLASVLERFRPDSAAIGLGSPLTGDRVAILIETAEQLLRADGIPIQTVRDAGVLESYAVPKIRNSRQLQPIVQSFWPQLGAKQLSAFEAIALGLYVQVERLLSSQN